MNRLVFHLLIALVTTLFWGGAISAQESQQSTNSPYADAKYIGILNFKAVKLVPPVYPASAKAVRASGTVQVQAVIDENGNMVVARAFSGHPLLSDAAVKAAMAAKFNPILIEGKPVKVTGILFYNFVLRLNLTQIGYELAVARVASQPGYQFPVSAISDSLPKEWSEEHGKIQMLVSRHNSNTSKTGANANTDKTKSQAESGSSLPAEVAIQPDETDSVTINSIIELLTKRFANDESKDWSFNLGITLGSIKSYIGDNQKLQQNLAQVKRELNNAPSNFKDSEMHTVLAKLAAFGEQKELTVKDKNKIEELLDRSQSK